MTVHHVIVAEPFSLDPDDYYDVTIRHVSDGGGCTLWDSCREPHLWLESLRAIAYDEGTDAATSRLAFGMILDAERNEHVWHGQRHAMLYDWWCVPVGGCAFEQADLEYDLPPGLLPGVYAVTSEYPEWDEIPDMCLTDEPVPEPERFL